MWLGFHIKTNSLFRPLFDNPEGCLINGTSLEVVMMLLFNVLVTNTVLCCCFSMHSVMCSFCCKCCWVSRHYFVKVLNHLCPYLVLWHCCCQYTVLLFFCYSQKQLSIELAYLSKMLCRIFQVMWPLGEVSVWKC